MKRSNLSTAALALLEAAPAFCGTYLRIRNGAEQYAEIETTRLPAEVVAPLVSRMEESGYAPYVPAPRPDDSWCTTWARTLELGGGEWREGWEEIPVPVPVDRERVVAALLALPGGAAKLSAALSSEAVASWLAENPVYVRGSDGARAVAAALGLSEAQLEALVEKAVHAGDFQ